MPADLTGLTPYVDYSKKLMDEAFPGGRAGFDDKALQDEINKRLWGTGTTPGVYSQFARRGLSELQPETQYATSRVVKESMEDLLNQYQARQIAALNTGRTAVLTEPTFRISEAGASGYYEGAPTPQTAYVQALERNAAEMRKREDIKNLAGGIGSLLNWLYPTGGRGGVGAGGLPGGGFGLMDLTGIPSLYSFLTGNKFPGLLPTGKSIFDSLFGGGGTVNTSVQPGATQWDWALDPVFNPGAGVMDAAPQINYVWDELSQSFVPSFSEALAPAAGAGAGASAAGGVNWTPELVNALYGGAPTGAGGGAGGAGALSGAGGAGVGSAAIAALAYLLSPQASPIPGMRDTSDQYTAQQTQEVLQDIIRFPPNDPYWEKVISEAAMGINRDFESRAIDALPAQYNDIKRRFWDAVQHKGAYLGAPGYAPPVPQAEQRVIEALAPWQLPGALTYAQMYPSAPPLYEPK